MSMNCGRCSKFVPLPEERRACNKKFHADCFTCGLGNSDGCQKKLTLDGYTDRAGVPYCKTCYGRNFGPKGFMTGSANFNNFDESSRKTTAASTPATTTARPVVSAAHTTTSAPTPPPRPTTTISSRSTSSNNADEETSSNVSSSAPASQQSLGRIVNDRNTRAIDNENLPSGGLVSSRAGKFVPTNGKSCAKCSRSVTLAEERLACKAAWHIDCFVCGGRQSDGCRKKLTLDSYTSHDDDPYCKSCYSKLFGPKGFMTGSSTINTFDSQPAKAVSSTSNNSSPRPVSSAVSSNTSSPRPVPAPKPAPRPVSSSASSVSSASSPATNNGRLVNDRNTPAIVHEVSKMPQQGSVRAALAALKKELPHNA